MGKWLSILLLLLIVVTCYFIWQVAVSPPDDSTLPAQSDGADPDGDARVLADMEGGLDVDPDSRSAQKVPVPASEPPGKTEQAAEEEGKFKIEGSVIDIETREPVKQFHIRVRHIDVKAARVIPDWVHHDDIDDEEGRFTFTLKEPGTYQVWVQAENYIELRNLALEIDPDQFFKKVEIEMEPAMVLAGLVIDDATERPIEGAEVDCKFISSRWRVKGVVKKYTSASLSSTRTDADGRFELADLAPGVYAVTASHPRYTRTTLDTSAGTENITIRMGRGYKIFGHVNDDNGLPVQGVEITYLGGDTLKGGPFVSDAGGYYETDPLQPCKLRVAAKRPEQVLGGEIVFTEEAYRIELKDQDVEVDFGPASDQVTWRGTYYGWDGNPMPHARLRVWNDWADNYINAPLVDEGPSIYRNVTCDGGGRFEIAKLVPGIFRVDMASGNERPLDYFGERNRVEFTSPGLVEMDLFMRRTELSGQALSAGTGEPIRDTWGHVSVSEMTDMSYYSTDVESDGRFCLRGLPPGKYSMQVSFRNFPAATHDGLIELGEDQIRDNLKILVPESGRLSVRVTGLEQIEGIIMQLAVKRLDGSTAWTVGPGQFTKDGEWVIDFPHETGSWILELSDATLGKLVRPYEVEPDKVAEVVLTADEFKKDG